MRTPEAEEAVLQYVDNKIPLALKRSVAAHKFLKKICFNEGYLSGPKVCRSNLETPCIHLESTASQLTVFPTRLTRICPLLLREEEIIKQSVLTS